MRLTWRLAFGVRDRCCLLKRRVNPIRRAFPELHPRSGLRVLTWRFKIVLVLVVVLVLDKWGWVAYCSIAPAVNWTPRSAVRDAHRADTQYGIL
jgi:hypothetical protein